MENVQQITQAATFTLPKPSIGENKAKVANVEKTPVVFQQAVEKPLDNSIAKKIEQKKEDNEDKERNEAEVVEADRIISVVNNKLHIVSDDRSRTGLVVKILNKDSGDLIKQIPSEEVLNLIARLKESGVGTIVDDNA